MSNASDSATATTLPSDGKMAWIRKDKDGELENLFYIKLPGPDQAWQHYSNIPEIAMLGCIPTTIMQKIRHGQTQEDKGVISSTLQAAARASNWSDGWFAYLALSKRGWKLLNERQALTEMQQALLANVTL